MSFPPGTHAAKWARLLTFKRALFAVFAAMALAVGDISTTATIRVSVLGNVKMNLWREEHADYINRRCHSEMVGNPFSPSQQASILLL